MTCLEIIQKSIHWFINIAPKKLEAYAASYTDSELKAIFERDAQAAKQAQQDLIAYLN
ncbi:hypothetical protein [Lysinibacillus sp. 54212]|uniref:hypothetical protein n=1 Tax=Lysinibacillus sp. 54212 TaxID=3119829 RepID=UPI002FC798C9